MSGGLGTLQTVSIVSAFPFTIIVIVSIISIIKALREEVKTSQEQCEKIYTKKDSKVINKANINLD
ncbi:hypothetical protein SDC9_176792 [bioreactor metagenome]|uniref:Uncharacterized protein n=2 Tax=root TaxID=1 RepID=A0A645GUA2_9ZZZZ